MTDQRTTVQERETHPEVEGNPRADHIKRELAKAEAALSRIDGAKDAVGFDLIEAAESYWTAQRDRLVAALADASDEPDDPPSDPGTLDDSTPPDDPMDPADQPSTPPLPPVPAGEWADPSQVGANVTGPTLYKEWGHFVQPNVSNVHYTAGPKSNSITNTGYSGIGPLRWDNVEVSGGGTNKWGMIAYGVEDWRFTKCTFRDMPVEHGLYLTLLGGIYFGQCLFARNGSQGFQGVAPVGKRAIQTNLSPAEVSARLNASQWDEHWFDECAFIDNGDPTTGARASYACSNFGGPFNPVRITRCTFRSKVSFYNNGWRESTGAIMAHGRRRVILHKNYIEYPNGDRSVIQLWRNSDFQAGTFDVELKENHIVADKAIDIRCMPGDSVRIQGNTGKCQVIVSTNATLNDTPPVDFNLNWREDLVQYRGSISDDVTLQIK